MNFATQAYMTNATVPTTEELLKTYSSAIAARDEYTYGHSHHVHVVTEKLYHLLLPEYALDKEKLLNAALLHDTGKIMIPDDILNKSSGLTDEEWHIMREHPAHGKRLLENTLFDDLGNWILYHHERMDGTGYYGLNGSDIPVESRIIALADTFSALRTFRIYRNARPLDATIAILRECSTTQLDGHMVDLFLAQNTEELEALQCNCEVCERHRQQDANVCIVEF